jgi:glutamate-1-semialdehyde aminotransferase
MYGEKMRTKNKNILWSLAKKKILGGNSLFSKRPDNFLPKYWPTYYSKAKGCYIWDLKNKKYIDMSLMGVGTNVLGYSNSKIDNKVIKNIKKSNMSTLNCPEEVYLAKKLIDIHPWASRAKFARSGGEANAIAIRIARAFTKTSKVAICGYHGWHDWYLSANLNKKNKLSKFLLDGLSNSGIPKELANTTFTFEYNNIKKLKYLIEVKKIRVIKMEVIRNIVPKNNFLKKVRELVNKNNCILIFDECTTGFRETLGGIHKKYKVNPDIAIFGKAIGNGYAITAVIGKEKIMKASESSFISSTFWSERIGPTAALATIDYIKKNKTWKIVSKQGKKIKEIWKKISIKYDLEIDISGTDSIFSFNFISKERNFYKTFLTYKMLNQGFLASNSVIVSISHTDKILKQYEIALDKTFKKISILKSKNVKKLNFLEETKQGFHRLN